MTRITINSCSVSVVIPCYRCIYTIKRTIDSIYTQVLKPIEVILVEDFSKDNTLECLLELANNYPKNWIKIIALEKNVGAGEARNIGWDQAQGKYVAFLDSDDSWHPYKIEIQFNVMESDSSIILSGHNIVALSKSGLTHIDKSHDQYDFHDVRKHDLLFKNFFATSTVMVRRNIRARFPKQRYSEDYGLWLNISFNYGRTVKINKELAFMYKDVYGEAGLSSNMLAMQKGEIENYKNLYNNSSINLPLFVFISSFSFFKHLRRLIITFLKGQK